MQPLSHLFSVWAVNHTSLPELDVGCVSWAQFSWQFVPINCCLKLKCKAFVINGRVDMISWLCNMIKILKKQFLVLFNFIYTLCVCVCVLQYNIYVILYLHSLTKNFPVLVCWGVYKTHTPWFLWKSNPNVFLPKGVTWKLFLHNLLNQNLPKMISLSFFCFWEFLLTCCAWHTFKVFVKLGFEGL